MGKFSTFVARALPAGRNSSAILKNFAASGRVRRQADRLPGSFGRSRNSRAEAQRSLLFRAGASAGAGAAGKDGSFPRIVSNRGI